MLSVPIPPMPALVLEVDVVCVCFFPLTIVIASLVVRATSLLPALIFMFLSVMPFRCASSWACAVMLMPLLLPAFASDRAFRARVYQIMSIDIFYFLTRPPNCTI